MNELDAPGSTEPLANGPELHADESKVFDAEYVSKLRSEAAEGRTAAKAAKERGDELFELLLTRSIEAASSTILIDPKDLPRDGDYFNDGGSPDLHKIRSAAEALAESKPYLSRPRGDISQGARESNEAPSFGDLLRGAL